MVGSAASNSSSSGAHQPAATAQARWAAAMARTAVLQPGEAFMRGVGVHAGELGKPGKAARPVARPVLIRSHELLVRHRPEAAGGVGPRWPAVVWHPAGPEMVVTTGVLTMKVNQRRCCRYHRLIRRCSSPALSGAPGAGEDQRAPCTLQQVCQALDGGIVDGRHCRGGVAGCRHRRADHIRLGGGAAAATGGCGDGGAAPPRAVAGDAVLAMGQSSSCCSVNSL